MNIPLPENKKMYLKKLWLYFSGMIIRPRKTIRLICVNQHEIFYLVGLLGIKEVLLFIFKPTFFTHKSLSDPVLTTCSDSYALTVHFKHRLILILIALLTLFLLSAFLWVLGKPFKGNASFKDVLFSQLWTLVPTEFIGFILILIPNLEYSPLTKLMASLLLTVFYLYIAIIQILTYIEVEEFSVGLGTLNLILSYALVAIITVVLMAIYIFSSTVFPHYPLLRPNLFLDLFS